MTSALLIRIHPSGPWRYGPGEGGEDRLDNLYRSDRLYSAVTLAFERLGWMNEWLEATARAPVCAVRFSSLFPFQGDSLFIPPPATIWPPPPAALRITSPVFSTKVRWRAAEFVPLPLIETLLSGQRLLVDQWIADSESRCMLRRDRPQSGPFRTIARTQLAIDRLGGTSDAHRVAAVEFKPGAGLWTVAVFSNEESTRSWSSKIRSAFRLLADSGFGGRRSNGWGQVARIEFQENAWPDILLPKLTRHINERKAHLDNQEEDPLDYWLLSLFSPSHDEAIEWSEGSYSFVTRGGRVESQAGCGREKKAVRMIAEGSVVAARTPPAGRAVDVSPDKFEHPVYRAGFALSIQIPRVDFSSLPAESSGAGELSEALDEALRAAVDEAGVMSQETEVAVEHSEEYQERTQEPSPEMLTQASAENEQPSVIPVSGTSIEQEISTHPTEPATSEIQGSIGAHETGSDQQTSRSEPGVTERPSQSDNPNEENPEKSKPPERPSPSPSAKPPELTPDQAELPERITQASGSDETETKETGMPDRSDDEPRNEV